MEQKENIHPALKSMDLVELLNNRTFKGKCSVESYHLDYEKLANYLASKGLEISQHYNEGLSAAETIVEYPEIFFEGNCFYDMFYNQEENNLLNNCMVTLMAEALGINYEYYETTFFYDFDYYEEMEQSDDFDPMSDFIHMGWIEVWNEKHAEFIIGWCEKHGIPYKNELDSNKRIVIYGFTEDAYFDIKYFDYVDENGAEKSVGLILDCNCGGYDDPEEYGIMDVIKSFDKNDKFFSMDEDAKMKCLIETFSEIISDTSEVVF